MVNMFWAVLKGPWDGHNNISNLCLHKNLITSPPTCVWRLVVMPSSKDFLSSDSTSIQCQRTKTVHSFCVHSQVLCALSCQLNHRTMSAVRNEKSLRVGITQHCEASFLYLSTCTQKPRNPSTTDHIAVTGNCSAHRLRARGASGRKCMQMLPGRMESTWYNVGQCRYLILTLDTTW